MAASRKQRPQRKLVRGAQVEMRSTEEAGFQGSWHPGTVISDRKRRRHVKYHHFVKDDGRDLVDVVPVSTFLDGLDSGNVDRSCYRGNIRPFPPKIEFSKSQLEYGLCVDVFHTDAWWEGVILDHNDDSEERLIFFPDLGDELKTGIDTLRITQDWDEVTDTWRQRGMWVFLELIEKYKQDCCIAGDPVKQIWYNVQVEEGFEEKIKEWTCPIRDAWEELVVKVIDDLLRCLPPEVKKSQETQVESVSAEIVSDVSTWVSAEIVSHVTPIAWLPPKSNAVVPWKIGRGKEKKRGR